MANSETCALDVELMSLERESGTGPGLPIADDVLRSHGGDIRLDTSPFCGLPVSVTVPA